MQYRLAAETYLPELLPDHAVVSVCLVTDNLEFMRKPSPGIPLYFTTNAGWLSSQRSLSEGGEPNRLFRSAEEAYLFYLNRYTLLGPEAGWAARYASRLAVTTAVWRLIKRPVQPVEMPAPEDPGVHTYRCLSDIARLCDSLGIGFTLAGIPPMPLVREGVSIPEIRAMHNDMFRDLELRLPGNIAPDDYATGPLYGVDDIHFNDSGHAKFANFLDSLLKPGTAH